SPSLRPESDRPLAPRLLSSRHEAPPRCCARHGGLCPCDTAACRSYSSLGRSGLPIPGKPSGSGAASADAALSRVPARQQVESRRPCRNLYRTERLRIAGVNAQETGALFFLEARVVGPDALKLIATPSEVQHLRKHAHR